MSITYTTSGSAVFTESFSLDLYAGTLNTDEEWLKGGATAAYPGNLDGFLAANTEANPATRGLKLVCGKFTTVLADDETLTLGGDASKIVAVLVGATSVANAGVDLKNITAGVAQFTVVGAPGTNVTAWMIVA
jgi:hypothetical protein